MGIWVWLQLGGKIWKVISDYDKGTICVYDEDGKVLLERKGLPKEVISIIETNFLNVVATKVEEEKTSESQYDGIKKSIITEIPMYA